MKNYYLKHQLSFHFFSHLKNSKMSTPKSKKTKANKQKPEISEEEKNQINQLIVDLIDPLKKENALTELCKRKDFPNLAVLLWYSTSTISSLLQDIISIYPYLHAVKKKF